MSNTDLTRTGLAGLGSTGYVISGRFPSVLMRVLTHDRILFHPRSRLLPRRTPYADVYCSSRCNGALRYRGQLPGCPSVKVFFITREIAHPRRRVRTHTLSRQTTFRSNTVFDDEHGVFLGNGGNNRGNLCGSLEVRGCLFRTFANVRERVRLFSVTRDLNSRHSRTCRRISTSGNCGAQ